MIFFSILLYADFFFGSFETALSAEYSLSILAPLLLSCVKGRQAKAFLLVIERRSFGVLLLTTTAVPLPEAVFCIIIN